MSLFSSSTFCWSFFLLCSGGRLLKSSGPAPCTEWNGGGGKKEKKLIIQVWKNALGLHLENSLQKPGQNQWSEALLSLVVLSVRNLDALKMIPGTHPASLTVDDQLKNSRIQQQSWEIIFIYIFITNIFSNRALFSWRADPSCLLSLCYKQHSHKSSSWLLFPCHSCTSPVHWVLVQHTSLMSGLSWTHQANRSIPHWTLQFKKHAAYFPGCTFHAKVSQLFLSHLYSHKNQKLYQSHGITVSSKS